MSNYKEFIIHFMTIVLLLTVPYFVVPNLSTNLKNYRYETNILESTRIDEREYTGKYSNKEVEKTLVLVMSDETEIRLSETEYGKYWAELQNPKNIGKRVKYYLANYTTYGSNPVQLEVENKIIYTPSESVKWGYAIVFMTICCTLYSGVKFIRYLKEDNKPAGNSGFAL